MNNSEAFQSKEKFALFIPERIAELTENGKLLDADRINAYPHDLEKAEAGLLVSGETADEKREQAMDFILEGKLIYQFLFAGAATRAAEILKGGSKYSFNSLSFEENAPSLLAKYEQEIKEEKNVSKKSEIEKEIAALKRGLNEFSGKDPLPVCLGAREILKGVS